MIDDKALIQPFATVLTGILIFLTIERSFKWQASIEERMATFVDLAQKASQSVINAYDVISAKIDVYSAERDSKVRVR